MCPRYEGFLSLLPTARPGPLESLGKPKIREKCAACVIWMFNQTLQRVQNGNRGFKLVRQKSQGEARSRMLHCIQLKTNIRTVAEDSPILPKTSTVLVTVAVLSLFLPFLASTTAHAQAPAGPNRPTGVPDGYVITTFGYSRPSCVRQLAEGEIGRAHV